jgi:hypothetical protein
MKNQTGATTVLLILFFLPGCSAAAFNGSARNRSMVTGVEYDLAWDTAIEVLAVRGWKVATMDVRRGVLVSETVDVMPAEGYMDCGSLPYATDRRHRGWVRLNLRRTADAAEFELRVSTVWLASRNHDYMATPVDCSSTGLLESRIQAHWQHDLSAARLMSADRDQDR